MRKYIVHAALAAALIACMPFGAAYADRDGRHGRWERHHGEWHEGRWHREGWGGYYHPYGYNGYAIAPAPYYYQRYYPAYYPGVPAPVMVAPAPVYYAPYAPAFGLYINR